MPSPRLVPPIPDLLSADPELRVDRVELKQTLIFAFAAGSAVDAFDGALVGATLPRSRWDRAHFSKDLFLEQLVERCLPVRIGGRDHAPCAAYLLRAIAEPPRDPAVAAFRREVLEELVSSKDRRAELERCYLEIVELRTLLCAGRRTGERLRRLEILRAVHDVVGTLAGSFVGATSGLARLRDFGEAVREGESYRRLDALLEHEQHLATVDLRVRVGTDGEIRAFQITAITENHDNPFHSSAIGRWIAKIRLFLRGYRVDGGEVTERIFDDVFTGLEESLVLIFQLLGDMEFHLAALGFRDLAAAKGLRVCFPELVVDDAEGAPGIKLEGLFNPLLLGEKRAPVPCDIDVARAGSVVIVTGPNSGGKTRLLQSIAFAQLLGEAGMFVPARAARLPRVSGLFVSIVDDSRADQPEGQLGMELLRIRRMFEELGPGSLVLLDELCSGTNPSEGEEIARLVISLLPELGAQVFVTTHLLHFAARLAEEPSFSRTEFLQVELDEHERATYGFIPGVARTSLAHKTAARLGVTRDELTALIAAKKRAPLPGPTPRASSLANPRPSGTTMPAAPAATIDAAVGQAEPHEDPDALVRPAALARVSSHGV
jgi:DNA mismatch repair protein MutS2